MTTTLSRIAALLLLLGAPLLCAAESPFTFPTAPVAPVAPAPGATLTLTGDTLLVVNSRVDASVRGYPAGLVVVTKEAGPLRIRGKFIDGNGKTETRTFPGPHVFIVEAAGTGRVDLVLTPLGLKSESEIEVRSVNVKTGDGPIPPPKPKPDPPKPDPKPVPVVSFRVALVFESGALLPPKQAAALTARSVEEYLTAKCTDGKNGWRRRDRDVVSVDDDTVPFARFWTEARPKSQGAPCVAFEINGTVSVEPLPVDTAGLLALIKKYAGEGK